ncbi:MAG: hypothetical protein WCP36_05780, partial [Methanomicrobiales archaeon]
YPLRFSLFFTVQTKTGPVTIPFGDVLIDNVNVATTTVSGIKMGIKAPVSPGTLTGISTGPAPGQHTATIPGSVMNRTTIGPYTGGLKPSSAGGYTPGILNGHAATTVFRNFSPLSGILWIGLLPVE